MWKNYSHAIILVFSWILTRFLRVNVKLPYLPVWLDRTRCPSPLSYGRSSRGRRRSPRGSAGARPRGRRARRPWSSAPLHAEGSAAARQTTTTCHVSETFNENMKRTNRQTTYKRKLMFTVYLRISSYYFRLVVLARQLHQSILAIQLDSYLINIISCSFTVSTVYMRHKY